MKERITYILAGGEPGVNPATIDVKASSLKLPSIYAAKEWRITLSEEELPPTLKTVLNDIHQLHVRWASLDNADNTPPFSARLPPGLHVFYTPLKGNRTTTGICDEIKSAFGPELRCEKPEEAFSIPQVLAGRFRISATYQYYQQLPLVNALQDYIRSNFCSEKSPPQLCIDTIESLQQASSLDFDFDTISQSFVVSARWPPARHSGWERQRSANDRVEIGILNREKATEDEHISLGGYLTVLGDDDEPKATLFSFPSRHHQLPTSGPESLSFTASFKQPTGLHPTLQLTFDKHQLEAPSPSCVLHAYLNLPSHLFIDRYQLADKIFLKSQNLVALHALTGETDLEVPDWIVKKWGSTALLELALPEDDKPPSGDKWTVSIPTHLRYLPPKPSLNASAMYPAYLSHSHETTVEPGKRTTTIPYPSVFWACNAEAGLKMSTNPFDRTNLGYDGLFGPKSLFWHVSPKTAGGQEVARLDVSLDVPVLDRSKTGYVEIGTGLAVLAGFLWVCWKVVAGAFNKTATPDGINVQTEVSVTSESTDEGKGEEIAKTQTEVKAKAEEKKVDFRDGARRRAV
ncbi:PIG-X-domain-containing protein [Myriangium duriaei CBS 260.36]|uniref:Protein PBN1 n=1 Tax=Myriangium duriaei CBS 260.36 TaxID=1168546 RepID=A0A9P4J0K4_9PEZI|nr:PIG-X-domain-containing protein [Myriangium duriaei CBS 260.36]